ncbi:MAG: hypothetical protein AABO58_23805 [Acidobacteriota bacterium]
MIERLNFYDLYGYLIPGAVLIGVIWLPFAVAFGWYPPADFGGAVLALIGAYVAGHILQAIATNVVPSTVDGQYPSVRMLDDDDETFTPAFKKLLADRITAKFGVDVKTQREARDVAFLQCRAALIASKAAAYVEQFQGMYVLMRGIAASAAIGCAFTLGWLWSPFLDRCLASIAAMTVVTSAALLAVIWRHRIPKKGDERYVYIALILAGVAAGGSLAAMHGYRAQSPLSAAAILELLSALWAFGAYRAFGQKFAATVYRDFMSL